ncbi:hypothetical protein [Limosilactobacillus reuteri]|uniref:hypothetical protein n=1 Tax=Limosilactobacillus reuteri TaxID=1598 RepID=UPI0026701E64|nr:hypothetical protein [Limosilactobacillus reuteri]
MWTNFLTGGALLLIALYLTGQTMSLKEQGKDYATWGCFSVFIWIAIILGAIGLVTKFFVQHHLRWIFMFLGILAVLVTIYEIFLLSRDGDNQESRRIHKLGITIFTILTLIFSGWYIASPSITSATSSSQTSSSGDYQQLGQKLNKKQAKSENDDAYYVDKDDNKARYFTNEKDIITAIKYNYMPDPMNATSVQGKLKEMLNDDNLKYGNDKVNEDDTTLDDDNYNVYAPKQKKWYHISMQKNDDNKVSTFSIWQGKDSDAE